MQNKKTYTIDSARSMGGAKTMMTRDSIASGMAFLVGELEKLDALLREPLTSVTYPRDIPIEAGGGWVQTISATNIAYGVSGGSGASAIGGGAQNDIRVIQANMQKDLFKAHAYQVVSQIKFLDMQYGNNVGRSLETMYDTGIRLDFDKHMDTNVYTGFEEYGSYGLLNNPNITIAQANLNGAGLSTEWKNKTPDEILDDINLAITACWKASGYDNSAIPNHILIDAENYSRLVSQKIDPMGSKSILTYLEENNIAKHKGVNLVIAECKYCEGGGTGNTNRMLVYVNEKRFCGMDLLVPMSRAMTTTNVTNATYDSLYVANIGETKIHYFEPIRYIDGI